MYLKYEKFFNNSCFNVITEQDLIRDIRFNFSSMVALNMR